MEFYIRNCATFCWSLMFIVWKIKFYTYISQRIFFFIIIFYGTEKKFGECSLKIFFLINYLYYLSQWILKLSIIFIYTNALSVRLYVLTRSVSRVILIIFSKLVRYRIQCIYTIIPREFFILKSLVIIYEKRTRLRSMWFTVTHSMASPRYYLYWRLIRFHRWTRMTVCTVWEAVDLRCFRSVTTTNRSRRLRAASYQLLLSSDVY